MVFNKYPITDFNNLNLDWLVANVLSNEEAISNETKERLAADANLLQLIQQIDPTVLNYKLPYTPQMFGAVADGVTDDSQAIQDCIDAAHAEERAVYFPGGTYAIASVLHDGGTGYDVALKVYDGDTLLGDGRATLIRTNVTVQRMLHSEAVGAGGYDAIHRLTIIGLNFDMNRALDPAMATTILMTSHAQNVRIKDCTFQNNNGWHCIELNSTKDSLVEGCIFKNCDNTTAVTVCEHIQIDAALAGTGALGLHDGTVCQNIVLANNIHDCSTAVGVGNHSDAAHHDIILTGCTFSNYIGSREAVTFVEQQYATLIDGCTFSNCSAGAGSNNVTTVIQNCMFNNCTKNYGGRVNVRNCQTDDGFITEGTNSDRTGYDANTIISDLPVASKATMLLTGATSGNFPVNGGGILESVKGSVSGNWGYQTFGNNDGLFYRGYRNGSPAYWERILASVPYTSSDLDTEFSSLKIPEFSICFAGPNTANRPASDGALVITYRGIGSGNYGGQLWLSNHHLKGRGYNQGWSTWKNIADLG